MRFLGIGPFVWVRTPQTRVEALRALLEPDMTHDESEDAQAEREVASLPHDTDPEPGAFYGLTAPEPEPTTHAHG